MFSYTIDTTHLIIIINDLITITGHIYKMSRLYHEIFNLCFINIHKLKINVSHEVNFSELWITTYNGLFFDLLGENDFYNQFNMNIILKTWSNKELGP